MIFKDTNVVKYLISKDLFQLLSLSIVIVFAAQVCMLLPTFQNVVKHNALESSELFENYKSAKRAWKNDSENAFIKEFQKFSDSKNTTNDLFLYYMVKDVNASTSASESLKEKINTFYTLDTIHKGYNREIKNLDKLSNCSIIDVPCQFFKDKFRNVIEQQHAAFYELVLEQKFINHK